MSWRGSRGPAPGVYSPGGNIPAPDPMVTKTEDSVLGSSPAAFASLSLREVLPTRPSYGQQGKRIILRANYFPLEPSLKLVLYRYNWSVKKEEKQEDKQQEGKKKKAQKLEGKKLGRVIQLCLESDNLKDFKEDIVTDFRAVLIARRDIPDQEITVAYRAELEDEPRQRATQYTLTLKKNQTLHAADLVSYLTSTDLNAQYGGQLDAIQALNILVNYYAKSSSTIATLGTSRSFPLHHLDVEGLDLGAGLTAMRGFFTSVRAGTARMLLNANVSHAAFYYEGSLDNVMRSFLNSNDNNRYRLAPFLKKVRISANHLKKTNNKGQTVPRIKTIYGLATQGDGTTKKGARAMEHPPQVKGYGAGAKDVKFWLNGTGEGKPSSTPKKKAGKTTSTDGRYISVYDYFKTTYRITIQDPRLPVINVGTGEDPSYLPAEVCDVVPGQRTTHHLSAFQTKKMIDFAVRGPAANAMSIVSKARSTTGISEDKKSLHMDRFGVTISPNLITVEGRVLREPQVVYGKKEININGGSWNMLSGKEPLKFAARGELRGDWSVLFVNMPNTYARAKTFTPAEKKALEDKLEGVLRETGISITGQKKLSNDMTLSGTDDKELEAFIKRAADKLVLLFVVLPAVQMPLYNRLKQLADQKYGIHTICSVGSKISSMNGQDQYLRNEALKVNLKFGGQNHHIQSPGLELINENKTMIVGIDVTHPSPGSSSHAPSISAMVASTDSKLGQWPGTLSIQEEKREEMVSDLEEMLKSRLRFWKDHITPHAYPENILVYRDGVSEGQYSKVLEEELPQLREACKKLYPVPDQKKGLPRMTLVIVGKRHHTRFYVTKAADGDRSGNPKAGTVVDRGVTEARSWDFFLQSHAAIKGTARPAHYFVLLDEIFRHRYGKKIGKNVADELQMTTQSLCYAFGRATKAVSYCTPAYLADILCERGRCYYYELYDSASSASTYTRTDDGTEENEGADASVSKSANVPTWKEVLIHPKLKDTMFYI
ncbi:ribonuclease H-like domain-containing protein [Xylaria castorea]|nr:ribonuclease H-like domain-containing protein [Xylaria castorea]